MAGSPVSPSLLQSAVLLLRIKLPIGNGLVFFTFNFPPDTIGQNGGHDIVLSHITGMTGTCHLAWPLVEMGSQPRNCLGWPGTMILPISTSRVAKIIDVSHCTRPKLFKQNTPSQFS
jgi:hypothetical protein